MSACHPRIRLLIPSQASCHYGDKPVIYNIPLYYNYMNSYYRGDTPYFTRPGASQRKRGDRKNPVPSSVSPWSGLPPLLQLPGIRDLPLHGALLQISAVNFVAVRGPPPHPLDVQGVHSPLEKIRATARSQGVTRIFPSIQTNGGTRHFDKLSAVLRSDGHPTFQMGQIGTRAYLSSTEGRSVHPARPQCPYRGGIVPARGTPNTYRNSEEEYCENLERFCPARGTAPPSGAGTT